MTEKQFPDEPRSFDDRPPKDYLPPEEPLTPEYVHDFLQRPAKLLQTYTAERDWGWGVAKTKLEIYESLGEPLDCVVVDLIWVGYHEQPDEVRLQWSLLWSHLMAYVSMELPDYLNKFSPAPRELLTTLKDSLPGNLKRYFKDSPPEPDSPPTKGAV
jgi:hypothetical protein